MLSPRSGLQPRLRATQARAPPRSSGEERRRMRVRARVRLRPPSRPRLPNQQSLLPPVPKRKRRSQKAVFARGQPQGVCPRGRRGPTWSRSTSTRCLMCTGAAQPLASRFVPLAARPGDNTIMHAKRFHCSWSGLLPWSAWCYRFGPVESDASGGFLSAAILELHVTGQLKLVCYTLDMAYLGCLCG